MAPFLIRRAAGLALTLVAASFAVFVSVYLAPGSPETLFLGGKQPTPEALEAARVRLGTDEPFLTRYRDWLLGALHGDFGSSLVSQQPVADRLAGPLQITLMLVAYAAVIIIVVGLGLGLLSALKPGTIDATVTAAVAVSTAIPAFVASSFLIAVFAVRLGWFPAFGLPDGAWGRLHGLTLPAIALAVIASGLVARVTRAAAMEQTRSAHVETATARGVSRARIVRAHVLRNAAGPVATVLGLQIAALFAGAVVVEQAFGLGGLGQTLLMSVQQKDFPVVQAVSLILVSAFVLLNLLAEVVGAALDPRARTWSRA